MEILSPNNPTLYMKNILIAALVFCAFTARAQVVAEHEFGKITVAEMEALDTAAHILVREHSTGLLKTRPVSSLTGETIYEDLVNNVSGSTDENNTGFDLWSGFSSSGKVATTITFTSIALEGSTGDDVLSTTQIFTVLFDAEDLTLLDTEVVQDYTTDVTAEVNVTIAEPNLTVSWITPANSEYKWKFIITTKHVEIE